MAMGMREGRLILKWSLFVFNLLFWFLGITVFGVGIYVKTDHSDYAIIMDEHNNGYSACLISVGVIVMAVGLLGCIGTLRENRILLIVYASAVGLIFVLECVAAGLGYQFRDQLEDEVIKGMTNTITRFDPNTNNNIRNSWISVQTQRECCGVVNFDDWLKNTTTWYTKQVEKHTENELPRSCCENSPNSTCYVDEVNHFNQSCYDVVYQTVYTHWKSLAGAAIGIAMIQVIGIILSAILADSVKKHGNYSELV